MADDDPFADLGETLEEEPDESDRDDDGTQGDDADAAPSPSPDSVDGTPNDEAADAHDPTTDAAFTYEAAQQRPFYARDGTIEDFDSWLNYELERELYDRGYQNIVVREMTDALLRTVVEADLVEAVAERFERARESTAPESDE